MIKLILLKKKNYIKSLTVSNFKQKSNIPLKVGVNKQNNYSIINYNLIILLQKYGLNLSKGLKKNLLTLLTNCNKKNGEVVE